MESTATKEKLIFFQGKIFKKKGRFRKFDIRMKTGITAPHL
jgi:hypothetical protein